MNHLQSLEQVVIELEEEKKEILNEFDWKKQAVDLVGEMLDEAEESNNDSEASKLQTTYDILCDEFDAAETELDNINSKIDEASRDYWNEVEDDIRRDTDYDRI